MCCLVFCSLLRSLHITSTVELEISRYKINGWAFRVEGNDVMRVWLRLGRGREEPAKWVDCPHFIHNSACECEWIFINTSLFVYLWTIDSHSADNAMQKPEQNIISKENKSFIQIVLGLQRNKLSWNKTRIFFRSAMQIVDDIAFSANMYGMFAYWDMACIICLC